MRYKVKQEQGNKRFLVVDSYCVEKTVAVCSTLDDARNKARWEEERWFKCTPDEEFTGWPKDLAAI